MSKEIPPVRNRRSRLGLPWLYRLRAFGARVWGTSLADSNERARQLRGGRNESARSRSRWLARHIAVSGLSARRASRTTRYRKAGRDALFRRDLRRERPQLRG